MLCLPKLVLRTIPVRGRRGPEQLVSAIESRLSLFNTGQLDVLWNNALQECPNALPANIVETRARKRQRTNSGTPTDRTTARVRELVGEGAIKKALVALNSSGLHNPEDPLIRARLEELHPAPLSPATLHLAMTKDTLEYFDPIEFWSPLIKHAILHFPRGSAGGPSGLRPCHLQDALRRKGGGGNLIAALCRLTHLWSKGQLPGNHGPC